MVTSVVYLRKLWHRKSLNRVGCERRHHHESQMTQGRFFCPEQQSPRLFDVIDIRDGNSVVAHSVH